MSARFQVLFHSPRRGSFRLSLTVLVYYRSSGVFSLGRWSALIPTVITRAPWYSSHIPREASRLSRTGLSPSAAGLSRPLPLTARFLTPRRARSAPPEYTHNPRTRNGDRPVTRVGFRLIPVRSPLLGEYSLLLGVLRCFSSPTCLPPEGGYQANLAGCPIRESRGDHE